MNLSRWRETVNRYIVNAIILVIAWGGMFRRAFNCDTLAHMVNAWGDIEHRMTHGRYLSAFQDWLLYQMGLSTASHTGITAMVEVALLAFAVCILQSCFEEKIGKPSGIYEQLAWTAIFSLVFTNVLFAESFMFGECALMFGIAYLLAALGIWAFTRRKYGLAFLFFILSTLEYQTAVIYAAIVLSAWIFIDSECRITVKTVILEIVCGVITIGAGVLNMLSLSLLARLGVVKEAARSADVHDWVQKAAKCMTDLGQVLLNSRGLLPKVGLPFMVLCIAMGIVIWKFWKEKKLYAIIYYILLVVGMIAMVYLLPMLQPDTRTYPRIIWTFYSMQAMLFLIAFWLMTKKGKEVLCYICGAYLLVQILFCNIIVTNHMVSNTLDKTYAMMVYEKIVEYEEETGQEVKKLAVANDIDCPFSYNNVYYKTDQINERALGTVSNTMVNIASGREFEKVPMDETVYQTYFGDQNWDYFDASEQLVIIGDTAYWMIF